MPMVRFYRARFVSDKLNMRFIKLYKRVNELVKRKRHDALIS